MATYTTTALDDSNLDVTVTEGETVTLNINPANVTVTGAVDSVNGLVGAVVLDTDNILEGDNLYHTEARVQAIIDTNSAGFITDYTVTENDVTQHQAALSITEGQSSDLS